MSDSLQFNGHSFSKAFSQGSKNIGKIYVEFLEGHFIQQVGTIMH